MPQGVRQPKGNLKAIPPGGLLQRKRKEAARRADKATQVALKKGKK